MPGPLTDLFTSGGSGGAAQAPGISPALGGLVGGVSGNPQELLATIGRQLDQVITSESFEGLKGKLPKGLVKKIEKALKEGPVKLRDILPKGVIAKMTAAAKGTGAAGVGAAATGIGGKLASFGNQAGMAGGIGATLLAMQAFNTGQKGADRKMQMEMVQQMGEATTPESIMFQNLLPSQMQQSEQANAQLLQMLLGNENRGPQLASGEQIL